MTEKERGLQLAALFCQHCRAIQKVYDYPAKCLYNPLTEDGKYAFCESCWDVVNSFLKVVPAPILTPKSKRVRDDAARIVFEAVMSRKTKKEFIENGISEAYPIADQILGLAADRKTMENK